MADFFDTIDSALGRKTMAEREKEAKDKGLVTIFTTSPGIDGGPPGMTSDPAETEKLRQYSSARAAKEDKELKETAKRVAEPILSAVGGIGDLLFKIAVAYFIINSLESIASKRVASRA